MDYQFLSQTMLFSGESPEEIKEMLDEYWNDEDPNIDTVAIAERIMLQLGKMIDYKHKN